METRKEQREHVANLRAQLAELDKRVKAAFDAERRAALARIRALMDEYRIIPNELRYTRRGTYNTTPTKPRYRDPDSGATWTGRGHPPLWIAGKNYADYLIPTEGDNT